jgi:uncharacterized membrane protein (Fun14 family)
MSNEALLSNIIPFAGSGLLGYAMGFALKKILKWMLIIVGFLAGMFFLGVQLLQKYGYVSTVNWDKLGNDTSTQVQHWATNADTTNLHGLFHTIGIPVALTSGTIVGRPIVGNTIRRVALLVMSFLALWNKLDITNQSFIICIILSIVAFQFLFWLFL